MATFTVNHTIKFNLSAQKSLTYSLTLTKAFYTILLMSKNLPGSQDLSTGRRIYNMFEKLSDTVDSVVGTPYWFALSLLLVVIWFPSGFFLGFGEIWHLMINTTTTILTFIMMSLLHASESKWESRIEKLEELQKNTLMHIKRDTDRIAKDDTVVKPLESDLLPESSKEKVVSIGAGNQNSL